MKPLLARIDKEQWIKLEEKLGKQWMTWVGAVVLFLSAGFFVKYGDSAADIMPLQLLYKTQVRQLARFIKVPDVIISKPPSPDLIPGLEDEFAIGISYEKLDLVLAGLEMNMSMVDIAKALRMKRKTIEYVATLVKRSEHMRNPPLIAD